MPKYVVAGSDDRKKEKARKKVSVLLIVSVLSIVAGFVFTALGFSHWGYICAALVFEVVSPFMMLLAVKVTMELKQDGGKSKAGK